MSFLQKPVLPVRISLYVLAAVIVFKFLPAQMPRQAGLPGREEAGGDLTRLSDLEKAAYAEDPAFFPPLPKPGANDWLAQQSEPGQTVAEYADLLPAVKPAAHQKVIGILPLGEFKSGGAPSLETLRQYCAAFFGRETRILEAIPLASLPAKQRINKNTQKRQLLTADILRWLPARKPKDACAIVAVTMEDLYPDESWNFVFGQAMLKGGVGVFSFARYDPAFFGEAAGPETPHLLLRRSAQVLVHETGHMFGLRHCIFYSCVMNGSNRQEESDRTPLHLCPVCLRKLRMGLSFDLLQREERLLAFYTSQGFRTEAEWTRRRIEKLKAAK